MSTHVNKAAMADAIGKKVGLSRKEAESMLEAFVEITENTLKDGGSVTLAGFGTFLTKTRAGRMGVNPQTPTQKMQIPSVRVAKFKVGSGLKATVKVVMPTPPVTA